MPALTSLASAVESKSVPNRVIRLDVALVAVTLAALWFFLCRQLSEEWTFNEQYNYGWFVPFFTLLLLWLRWEDRPRESRKYEVGSRKQALVIAIAAAALLALLPLRVFEIGNPDWRPLGWIHAAAVVTFTLVVIWYVGGAPWLRHFAFPILFFFVAVPWITPIEVPIIQGLMRAVATVATETITLLGIPAQVEGSLIRIHNGLVGVNEACSGVRSLQTSLMIGLLFGELKRLSIWGRLELIAGAIAIALVSNFCRAVLLVWIAAAKGVAEVDRWHDIAGYIIVGIVFIGTLCLASLLSRNKAENKKNRVENKAARQRDEPIFRSSFLFFNFYFLISALVWIAVVEVGAHLWYRAHETNLAAVARWDVHWPESAPNFHELKIQEGIKGTLRFDDGREVAWREDGDSPNADMVLLYFFRWRPGTTTVLRARAHRPDICLPSAGWRQTADKGVRRYRVTDNFAVPFRHFAFTRKGTTHSPPVYAHAFFCLHEDTMRPGETAQLDETNPAKWSQSDRWRVVREGIRNPGQQVMETIFVSPRQMDNGHAEEQFAALVPELIQIRDNNTAGLRDQVTTDH